MVKARWHDAYNRIQSPVESYRFANDVGITTESPIPQAIADDYYTVGTRFCFLSRKCPAQNRSRSQDREKVRIEPVTGDRFCIPGAGKRISRVTGAGQTFKYVVLGLDVRKVRGQDRRDVVLASSANTPNHYQPVRVSKRQPAQQDVIDDSEDRRVGSDPQSQSDYCNGSRTRIASQNSYSKLYVTE